MENDTNDDNDTAVTGEDIEVQEGFVEFSAAIDSSKLPPLLLAGDGSKLPLSVTLTNTGNVSTNSSMTVDITVLAREVQVGSGPVAAAASLMGDNELGSELVKVGTIKPGKSKTIKINVENTVTGLNGDFELVTQISPTQDLGGSPIVEATSEPIAFAGSFLDLTLFNVPNVTRRYEASTSGSVLGMPLGGSGLVDFDVNSFGNGFFELSAESLTTFERESFLWKETSEGTALTRRTQELGGLELLFVFDDLLVGPESFQLKQPHQDTADLVITLAALDLDLDGSVTVVSELKGYVNDLTVPFGTFDVAKINAKFTYEGTGTVVGPGGSVNVSLKFTETFTLYASPEAGVVKIDSDLSLRFTGGGLTESGSGRIKYKLVDIIE